MPQWKRETVLNAVLAKVRTRLGQTRLMKIDLVTSHDACSTSKHALASCSEYVHNLAYHSSVSDKLDFVLLANDKD